MTTTTTTSSDINFNKLCFGLLLLVCHVICENEKPHIIVILADDMGWNDVSFHGADQIPTPNIDALAYNGIILNNHYSQALCTPSRAAFLTGKYPIHMGMQHSVLLEPEPRGLPLEEKLMPEYLREAGYSTHAIGKWHLGFYKKEYTPTYRGFDSHYGYWNGLQDYYTHDTYATFENMSGYDMRRNMNIDWDAKGKYSTTLFTDEAVRVINKHNTEKPMFMYFSHLAPHSGNRNDPLQAPDEEVAKFSHIPDPERRVYAAMVSMLDNSIGTVVAALREKKMLENSIIIFISDNGAQSFGLHANYGSNYPLRGMKATPWEGGSRSIATIWSPLLKKTQYVSNELMHITDWLPTLMTAIGIPTNRLVGPIDGMNVWESLSENTKSPRQEMVYNIDDTFNYSAIRRGDWKYVFGSLSPQTDGWSGDSGLGEQYFYEEEKVLYSKVNIALTGVITKQQIQEKHSAGFKNTYSHKLLTIEKIQSLRNASTVHCTKSDSTEFKCNPLEAPCLFNVREDPCEIFNYARERPIILKNLENAVQQIRLSMVPEANVPSDPNSNPINWNNTWVNWLDCELVRKEKIDTTLSPTSLAILGVLCTLFFIIVMVLIAISVKSSSIKKQNSHNDLFTRHDENLDAPTGVVNIISDSNDNLSKTNGSNFQNNEQDRHNGLKHISKNIH